MDLLSDTLTSLKPKSSLSAGFEAGGDWSLRFSAPEGIKFNTVVKGECCILVEGFADVYRAGESDCFLLTRNRPFVLASDPSITPADSAPLYAKSACGFTVYQGGGDFLLYGGKFQFSGDYARMLFDQLPPVIVISREQSQAAVLRWALDQFVRERREALPGGQIVAENLFPIMLIQALRIYLADEPEGTGWLYALSDRRLGKALASLHGNPGHGWTLGELAEIAGMSRSLFAEQFRRSVGIPPMEYLTQRRMLLASVRLGEGRETVSELAYALGYSSESAFSTAFKRVMNAPPRDYKPAG